MKLLKSLMLASLMVLQLKADQSAYFQDALTALKDLRLLMNPGSGLGYDAYVIKLLDIKIKVNRYITTPGIDDQAGHSLRAAMLEYDLIRLAMSPEKQLFLANMGEIIEDRDVSDCSALGSLTDESLNKNQQTLKNIYKNTAELKHRLLHDQHVFGKSDNLGLNFLVSPVLRTVQDCASDQITKAERTGEVQAPAPSPTGPAGGAPRPQPVVLPAPAAAPPPTTGGLRITGSEMPDAEPAQRVATPKPATQTKPVTASDGDTPTGQSTTDGQPIYTGPRGGQYHYSSSGKKVYEKKKK